MRSLKVGLLFLSFMGMLSVLSCCEGSKSRKGEIELVQSPPFIVNKAYSQEWISGVKGGGSGTNIHITFSELPEELVFQDMFFKDQIVNAQVSTQNKMIVSGFFKNSLNRDVIMDSDPVKESQNTPPLKIPFQLDDQEAVISYLYKGSLYYYKIKDIEEKPQIAYPGANREDDH